jgi:uncharacterized protein
MSSGLFALFDDVAAIAKAAAASIDDVAAQAVKASSKAAGVVIDDAAVTPKYVVGLTPARELPIVWNIAKGSLKNKLFILLPAIMLLGVAAPWSIGPILALGGIFLCFEGYEKLHHMVHHWLHPTTQTAEESLEMMSPEELEKTRTAGAIRTDFILSAEIMAISYAVVKDDKWFVQFGSLLVSALAITAGVYGFVALVLKADDLGLHLIKNRASRGLQAVGRGLIVAMPILLKILGFIGMAAMLWVGGGIIIHSIPPAHHHLEELVGHWQLTGFVRWCVEAGISLVFAIIVGAIVVGVIGVVQKLRGNKSSASN